MAIGVSMFILVEELPNGLSLDQLRVDFKQKMSLTDEDFYLSGPLVLVDKEDYEVMPIKNKNYTWININLYRAYYGIGYERGDIELYVKIAEWFEKIFVGCKIYYGNDSTEESLYLFDEFTRNKLLEHYYMNKQTRKV